MAGRRSMSTQYQFCLLIMHLLINHACYSEKQGDVIAQHHSTTIAIQVSSNVPLNLDLILVSPCLTCFN